jgi:N-acetylneuraminic acid mutarotase
MKRQDCSKISSVFTGVLSFAVMVSAAEEIWTRKADMPTARFGLSTGVVDGKVYAIGGGKTMYGAYLSTVEEYDPATDTWTKKADMPTARNGHAAGVVNGKIYVIGGEPSAQASIATVEEYDPATDTWTRKADMPTKRTFLCASAVNGKIYAIGGTTTPAVEEYDPARDAWTKKADMPTQRSCLSASIVDGKIYVIGGVIGDVHNAPISTVEEYDAATDTWTRKANMPTARVFHSTSVVDGKIYAVGGAIWPGTVFSTVEEYDPTTDTWTTKPDMPTARSMLSTSAVNGKIYAIGGTVIATPWAGISTVEEYDTGLGVPLPDFNSDEIVDFKDFSILVQHWSQEKLSVDIAPPPFGDRMVDFQDLAALAAYWLKEVLPTDLIAYWKLDETEGTIANDSVADNDGTLNGNPVWDPAGGKVNGALQLDGVDDYVGTPFILDPGGPPDGGFSVFAWVKGGGAEQAIISQAGGVNWLAAGTSQGKLMTELKAPGRFGTQLFSEAVIIDGDWHRVGLTWDGSTRTLFVDGVEVAKSTQGTLASSTGGLYIGASKSLEGGSFWSGLIDDVRICDRAVRP